MSLGSPVTCPDAETTPPAGPIPCGMAASRRMCAAVYLDREFRDKVLREVYCGRTRRVAPSYGFNLVVVVLHAWRALILEFVQNAIILATLVVALIEFPLKALIAAGALTLWHLAASLLRLAGDFAAYYRGKRSYLDFEKMRSRGDFLVRSTFAMCIVFAATIAWEWHTSGDKGVSWLVRSGAVGASSVFAVIVGSIAITSMIRQAALGHLHRRNVRKHGSLRGRLATIDVQQRHPITVYSGFRPFIGSGVPVRTWSFAQRLVRYNPTGHEADQEYDQPPFKTETLVSRLTEEVMKLKDEENPETRLPGITVSQRAFIEGTHAHDFIPVLAEIPGSPDISEAISRVIANSSDVARHYLACEVDSWGGEVVTTVFMHVSLRGRTLYIEFSTCALLPTRSEYHVVDEFGQTGSGAIARAGLRSLSEVADAFYAPSRLMDGLLRIGGALLARRDGTLRARRGVNIGAGISMREEVAEDSKESYFQLRDITHHWKIIERRLIATVDDFLKGVGVDTSEFLQRATAILNSGVVNLGEGTVNISGSAIGDRASVTVAEVGSVGPE